MPRQRPAAYAWYTTGLLMVAYSFSFLDRQILTLMVGPIKADLGISDSQFALLSGGAFGLFYTVMGLPIGWLADRCSRKWLIAAGIAAWSLMTAACGLSRSYPQLLLARLGVGVGEATLSPSTYSLLADRFDRATLPRAMSLYTFGLFIGGGLAMILGGQVVSAVRHTPELILPVIGATRSWQLVFILVGLPGLALAGWLATLEEPARRDDRGGEEGIAALLRFLGRYPLMCVSLFLGPALFSMVAYADSWYPELFMRTWGWSAARAGAVNGVSSLICGPIGLVFAGWLSSRWIAWGRTDACLRLTAFGALGIAIPSCLMPLMPNDVAMALWLIPIKFFVGFPPVLMTSAIQMVAPERMRAQLGALFLLAVGVIGVTCGPLLPAFVTDHLFHDEGALRYALSLTTGAVGPLAFLALWLGRRQYRVCLRPYVRPMK